MDSPSKQDASQLPVNASPQRPELTRKPSLLPAFEPLSSSPFSRPSSSKRKYDEYGEDLPAFPKQQLKYYPTPVPTSETGILTSSPNNAHPARPGLQRTISTLSERQPLGAVPSIDVPADGEPVRMGRSSNSSDYQLSANRLISRVHVQAAYHAPTASYPNGRVNIECLGWNGAMVHCGGEIHVLSKGETFVADNRDLEIMLDVQDTRVMIAWPLVNQKPSWDSRDGSDEWQEDESPTKRQVLADAFASSPPIVPRSPVSQSPMRQPNFAASPVKVFEDVEPPNSPTPAERTTFIRPSVSRSGSGNDVKASQSSALSSFQPDDFSDGDEENDPVVHSFGPFGENLLPRLASFSTATPKQNSPVQRRRLPLAASQSPQQRSSSESVPRFNESPIKNHVINQLAFSRLHSIPLSTIHGNLPAELKCSATKLSTDEKDGGSGASTPTPKFSRQDLKTMMDGIACIGEIPRQGKDAAGKVLENEFYYVPEMDTDQMRRDAVTGSRGGTGLRAVRKSHKVCHRLHKITRASH